MKWRVTVVSFGVVLGCRQTPVAAQSPGRNGVAVQAVHRDAERRDAERRDESGREASVVVPGSQGRTTNLSGVSENMVERVCGSPRERAVRSELPALPRCGGREIFSVATTLGGRLVRVAGWTADPCCTDVGGAEYRAGMGVWSRGRALDALSDAGALASGATREARQAALQAVLLESGATRQVVTEAEVTALLRGHPEATRALRESPPGWVSERELRVWSVREEHERGVSCWILEPREAALDLHGVPRARAVTVSYGVGTRLGRPCGARLP